MTQKQALARIRRAHWRALEKLVRGSYQEGYEAGLEHAHGQKRRGRTIRADATVEGLIDRVVDHFGLDRYAFDIRVVHKGSRKHVPLRDLLARYRVEE
ncbi:MAG TPA: hypothetical protein VMS88_05495 [Terriglobales bacterium]|nr:hypothetical protein [Terriglobales bacterium]